MQDTQGYRLNEILANYRQRVELPSYLLVVDWFDRAFRALASMHTSGRLHRSIDPDKVFVSDEEVRIDGGSATDATGALATSRPADYAAPEQLAGRVVEARSDVYSLGAVFYELLTLRRPGMYPDPPSSVNVTVPKGFDAILLRTLATNPEDRYATADEVLADLTAFRQSPGSRILPGQVGQTSHSVRPAGVPRPAMIAAGAIIGAVGGAIAGWFLQSLIPATVLVGAIVGGAIGAFANPNV